MNYELRTNITHIKRQLKVFLLNLFYRKLWVKIAFILAVVVTIPVAVLGILLIRTSQEAVRKSVLNNHEQIALRAAQEIELFIRNPRDLLKTTSAMLEVMYPDSWGQETLLVELVLNHPVFMRVAALNLAGEELASSDLDNKAGRVYEKEILDKIKQDEPYSSKVKILDNQTPYLTLAVPIKKMGKIKGGLLADVNLRGMWRIVDNITLEETGRAFLVSEEGVVIAHQDKKRVMKHENLKAQTDVAAVLAGWSGAMEITLKDDFNEKWISSYAPVSNVGWGIVLRQRQEEAYLFLRVMKIQSWIIIFLSELVVIFVSIFLAKVLVQPIKTLVSRIKSVAAGDLNHKIKVNRRDEIGELIRTYNDMTEKLKKARVRERFSAIGEAASSIAHELKNSLVSIKSFIQLFPRRHSDEKFVDKFNKLLPEEVSRWECLLKELSDFSSHSDLKITRINAKELLDDILAIMEERFQEKRIEASCRWPAEEVYLFADSERLKQVFMNLIINAVTAMPQGGTLTISTTLTAADLNTDQHGEGCSVSQCSIQRKFVCISIQDTGCGIPKEMREKIFEPFSTTRKGGMGLGLAISRRIVEQHGGSIDVESGVDIGTTFIVKLHWDRVEEKVYGGMGNESYV